MSRIAIIVAMTDAGVIGIENRLPWHLPGDMQWFRRHTLTKPIIMGRKTYDSIGKPLPKRRNIVITRNPRWHAEGVEVVHDIDTALATAGDVDEVMIIGGASFYAQLLPRAERLYLTLVHADIDGDAHFPELDMREWLELERTDVEADENNPHPHSFLVLARR